MFQTSPALTTVSIPIQDAISRAVEFHAGNSNGKNFRLFKIWTGASYVSTIITPPLRYNEPTLTEKEALP